MSRLRRTLRRVLRRQEHLVIDLRDAPADFLLAVQRLGEHLPVQRASAEDAVWTEYRG